MRAARPRAGRAGPWPADGGQRRRLARLWPLLTVAALLLAGCASDDPQNALSPKGPVARLQDDLWNIVFPIAIAVFVLVQGLVIAAIVKFRSRPGDGDELPKQVAGNTRLEVFWTIIPAAILVAIALPTVRGIFLLAERPEDPLEVRVVGKQYWWEFEYTGEEGQGVVTANEMYIPAGRPVLLTMESTGSGVDTNVVSNSPQGTGVIHSFWVPQLAGKQDVVPGHQRTMTIQADEPGFYLGQCAEYCGLSHANMRHAVIAVEPAEFEAWIDAHSQPAPEPAGDAELGAQLFAERQCIACHAIKGYTTADGAEAVQRIGPDLTHFNERERFAGYMLDTSSDEQLFAWLKNPPEVKPGSQMPNLNLSDRDVEALIAYLRTLGQPGEESAE